MTKKRGVVNENSGLGIILSVVVLLFLIGIVIFLFVLFGSEIKNTTDAISSGSIVNESLSFTNGTSLSVSGNPNLVVSDFVLKYTNGTTISPSSYTIVNGVVYFN
jgi:hypothetical protein